jgi:DNA integrity scanning protein DisA with diadenylate cyclase activity
MTETTFAQTQQAMDAWKKLMEEQMKRLSGVFEEAAKLSDKSVQQAVTGIDEMAKLMKESVSYVNQLGAEWRKLAMDATKNAQEAVTSRMPH